MYTGEQKVTPSSIFCSECGEWFDNITMEAHKKAHGPQYTCNYPGCIASFKNPATLENHKRRFHMGNAKVIKSIDLKKRISIKHPSLPSSSIQYHGKTYFLPT